MSGLARRLATARYQIRVFARIWSGETWNGRLRILRYSLSTALVPFARRSDQVRTYRITLQGRDFFLELGRGELAAYLEVWLERTYERLPDFAVEPGWFVVDVGANVGFFAVRQATRGAEVVAIEPNPFVVRRLEQAVRANELATRITVMPCAAGRDNQRGWLRVDRNTVMGFVSVDEAGAGPNASRVEIRPLDEILRERHRAIDLLKIDTEGAEYDVLLGSRDTLSRTKRVVLEFHSDDLHARVRDLLDAAGFDEVLVTGTIAYFTKGSRARKRAHESVVSRDAT